MEDSVKYDLEEKADKIRNDNNVPNKKYTRRVYSSEEIKDILKDYIEVSKNKYSSLRAGHTRVCYVRADDNSFCRGGYITVNPIEKKDGSEIYMQLRGNVRKAGKGNVMWLVGYSGMARLWVFCGAEFEYAKSEIKRSENKQRAELAHLVDKISQHLRNLKREIRDLKRELKKLKDGDGDGDGDDAASAISNQTALTNFSALKIYKTDTESD